MEYLLSGGAWLVGLLFVLASGVDLIERHYRLAAFNLIVGLFIVGTLAANAAGISIYLIGVQR